MIDKREIRQICFDIIYCEILYGFDLEKNTGFSFATEC